jgi:hypothetical protein
MIQHSSSMDMGFITLPRTGKGQLQFMDNNAEDNADE